MSAASSATMPVPGPDESVCRTEPGCITCGDVAVPLTVRSAGGTVDDARSCGQDVADVWCTDEHGRGELVATELVGMVAPGDRLLVHAGVAIERLAPGPDGPRVPVATER